MNPYIMFCCPWLIPTLICIELMQPKKPECVILEFKRPDWRIK